MVAGPALYVGRLRHRRFRPRPHAFTYSLFMVLLDVDRLEEAMAISPFTSVGGFNWATFDHRDHVGDPALPIRERLRRDGDRLGHAVPGGPIYLLTHLRYFGYNFNPISFYYCFEPDGRLATVVGEVHNTFGEERLYWLTGATALHPAPGWRTPKTLHVSPFMPMDLTYEFRVSPPGRSLVAHMTTADGRESAAGPSFDATLTLERRPWTARDLHRALRRHPWMTAKVIAAIHWEALRLRLKGVPVHAHPNPDRTRRSRQEVGA
jgi:DUF1365 family protein